ncbi:MAG: RimK family alpha-L-glutamate ligase [Planctomycetales bacterium]
MHIAILSHPDSWYRRDLSRAAQARGHQVTGLAFERLASEVGAGGTRVAGTDAELTAMDAVIVRTMPPGSLEQVVFRMNLLAELEARGVQVFNPPRAIECAVDKYRTTARLKAVGLPVPETIVCEDAETAQEAFDRLGGDVVVKPIFGSEGRGIFRVSDPDLALRSFRTLERLQAVLYLQQFIPHEGFDVRVMVLDGEVLAGMRRVNPHDFRTNVSRQARAEPVELTPMERDWALRAASAVGARMAGIDILYDRSGAGYVIEVNGVPGWQALARVTDCDVADRVIAALEKGPTPPA